MLLANSYNCSLLHRENVNDCILGTEHGFATTQDLIHTLITQMIQIGAVAALLYADEDNMLDAMVLDSPFASLRMCITILLEKLIASLSRRLSEELVNRATSGSSIKIPGFAIAAVLRLVRSTIRQRADVDINEIDRSCVLGGPLPSRYANRQNKFHLGCN